MITIFDIAAVLVNLHNQDRICCPKRDNVLSGYKLQKLCYYAQGTHLAFFGEPLFAENITATASGPAVLPLADYLEGKGIYGVSALPALPFDENCQAFPLDPKVLKTLNSVYRQYGVLSQNWLSRLMELEQPWLNRFQSGSTIGQEELRRFFEEKFRETRPPVFE